MGKVRRLSAAGASDRAGQAEGCDGGAGYVRPGYPGRRCPRFRHQRGASRPDLGLLPRWQGQLRRRPGRRPGRPRGHAHHGDGGPGRPGVPGVRRALPGHQRGHQPVPRHRDGPAHREQHPRGGPAGQPAGADRVRGQRPDRAVPRPRAADQRPRRECARTSTRICGTPRGSCGRRRPPRLRCAGRAAGVGRGPYRVRWLAQIRALIRLARPARVCFLPPLRYRVRLRTRHGPACRQSTSGTGGGAELASYGAVGRKP